MPLKRQLIDGLLLAFGSLVYTHWVGDSLEPRGHLHLGRNREDGEMRILRKRNCYVVLSIQIQLVKLFFNSDLRVAEFSSGDETLMRSYQNSVGSLTTPIATVLNRTSIEALMLGKQ